METYWKTKTKTRENPLVYRFTKLISLEQKHGMALNLHIAIYVLYYCTKYLRNPPYRNQDILAHFSVNLQNFKSQNSGKMFSTVACIF